MAFLIRYAILPAGVSASDTGTSGSASGDVDKINSWFWSDARYLYPELVGSWDYRVNQRLQAGLEGRIYFPLGSLIQGDGFDTIMGSISARIIFR
jgi:hypothetical protein